MQSLWKTVWRHYKKLRLKTPYDPAIQLLGIHPKEMKSLSWTDSCIPIFIKALLRITETWKQPKCLSTDELIKKMWCIYTKEYYLTTKRREPCHMQQWRKLEGIMLNEMSQRKYYRTSFIYWTYKKLSIT